ncbi:MAG TPA: redoxin domain-containing protein, partial [Verrucomicrobiae bacterium]|nr:redoxin domain-containing protein [Verrucomicrobiae bacterium]
MRSRVFPILFAAMFALCGHAAKSPLDSKAKIVVLVFVSSECPISNKFAPELERLSHKFPTNEVCFTLVYPNASDTASKIKQHRRDYQLTGNFLRDPKHELVKKAGVTITPETAVFDEMRNVVYRGRVNDQYLALGKGRPQPTEHDLEDAIAIVLEGKKPKQSRTEPVGCLIQDR